MDAVHGISVYTPPRLAVGDLVDVVGFPSVGAGYFEDSGVLED